jgi:hypothetical protein
MRENMRIVRCDGAPGVSFSVPRVIVAIETVAKAAEREPIPLPFNDDGVMEYPTIAQFTSDLRDLIAGAMKNEGSLTVRFLGDLKPSVYPVDTHFFHLNESTTDGSEFTKLIQKAMLESGKSDITFVNLSTTRDVKLHVGNHRAIGTTDDLSFLTAFCDTMALWADLSLSIKVEAQ